MHLGLSRALPPWGPSLLPTDTPLSQLVSRLLFLALYFEKYLNIDEREPLKAHTSFEHSWALSFHLSLPPLGKYSLKTEATGRPETCNGKGLSEGPVRWNRGCASDFLEVKSFDKGCSVVMVTSHCGQQGAH